MVKVITYGTYDLLHYGHIRLLERAKALGDYLIVGVTADDFDKVRGKINVHQSLIERIEAVRATGIADEIIVEEYEGQKIDDIRRLNVDIFTVGSDWVGYFDYLNEYCKVVYLDRTQGISSSAIRSEKRSIRLGLVGNSNLLLKHLRESNFVNGIEEVTVFTEEASIRKQIATMGTKCVSSFGELLGTCDAIYIVSHPLNHYEQVKQAILQEKHVLCESPIALSKSEYEELLGLAKLKKVVLMDALKTAYTTAYSRLLLLVKSGKIGKVVSIDSVCTSLSRNGTDTLPDPETDWNSICAWGPTAMLPIFHLLGTEYLDKRITSFVVNKETKFDAFTKIDFTYPGAVASARVGKGVKSEGELIISGTKGYIYVPAPWWKTDYFEIRYENPANNRRYFYQLDGEGIRYELVAFMKAIQQGEDIPYIGKETSLSIVGIVESFFSDDVIHLL